MLDATTLQVLFVPLLFFELIEFLLRQPLCLLDFLLFLSLVITTILFVLLSLLFALEEIYGLILFNNKVVLHLVENFIIVKEVLGFAQVDVRPS